MELKSYFSIFRKWLSLIITFTLIVTIVTTIAVFVLPPTYKASALLIVNRAQGGTVSLNDVMTAERLARTYAEVITKRPTLEKVIDELKLTYSPQQLKRKIEVRLIRDTQLIEILVKDSSPQKAAILANALAQKSSEEIVRLQKEVAQDGQVLNTISVVEKAVAPETPDSPKKAISITLSFILASLAVTGIFFLIEYLDDTLRSESDVETFLGVVNLGSIPYVSSSNRKDNQLVTLQDAQSSVTEAFRELRTNIQFSAPETPYRSLVITSSSQEEGKSIVAANLAIMIAKAGYKTVLIDADLRRPIQHELFKLDNHSGLSTFLTSEHEEIMEPQITSIPNLFVLTSGPFLPNPTEWLGSTRLHQIIEKLKERSFHFLILDSPPIGMVTDAAVLASMLDAAIVCIEAGKTPRGEVQKSIDAITRVGGKVLGTILNFKKPSRKKENYYYQKEKNK